MDNEIKYTTSLRLYKKRPMHAQAYKCLKTYNRDIFKTKDDFIAEAVIYFDKYLKQEKEAQKMELLNTYLENQKGEFLEMMQTALLQVQTDTMAEVVKNAVGEALKQYGGNLPDADTGAAEKEPAQMEDSLEKDIRFAQFYAGFEE